VANDNLAKALHSSISETQTPVERGPAGKPSELPRFTKSELLIIGFGSSMRGDDAAGPHAARLLAQQGYRTKDVHQLTPELAEDIASAREVVFLDAHSELAPGQIAIERLTSRPNATAPLEHSASPAGLLRLTRRAYGAEPMAWLIGMGGSDFELSDRLTPAAEIAVERAIEEIVRCTNPGSSRS
jgi:hydrogenase maturation protease